MARAVHRLGQLAHARVPATVLLLVRWQQTPGVSTHIRRLLPGRWLRSAFPIWPFTNVSTMAATSRCERSHRSPAAIRGRVKVKLAENFRNECSQRELAARTWEAGGSGSLPPWETPNGPGWRRTSSNGEALTSVSRCHRRERLGEGGVDQTSTRARGVPRRVATCRCRPARPLAAGALGPPRKVRRV